MSRTKLCCSCCHTSCGRCCARSTSVHCCARQRDMAAIEEQFQAALEAYTPAAKPLLVIINPHAGGGQGEALFNEVVLPIFQEARVNFLTPRLTERAAHATEIVRAVDPNSIDGIVAVGGDGLVLEVITGIFTHEQRQALRYLPLCIVPGGTANALSNLLYPGGFRSRKHLASRAGIAVLERQINAIDVLQFERPNDDPIYGLVGSYSSVFGWGFAGTVCDRAEGLRHLPFHRLYRYDLAGLLGIIKDFPLHARAKLSFRPSDGSDWVTKEISIANMLATNVPKLGQDHPITDDLYLDDGNVCVTYIDSSASRAKLVTLLTGMKHGRKLADQKGVEKHFCKEFKLEPTEDSLGIPFNIDGDPFKCTAVHCKNLHLAITCFVGQRAALHSASAAGRWERVRRAVLPQSVFQGAASTIIEDLGTRLAAVSRNTSRRSSWI